MTDLTRKYAGRYRGMTAQLLQRVTGLLLLAYLFLHVRTVYALHAGPAAFDRAVGEFHSPFFRLLEIALFGTVVLHAVNGLRITLMDRPWAAAVPMPGPRFWWWLQRVTGGILFVLLIVHFWVEHLASAALRRGDLDYAAISARINRPLWQCLDIAFLLIALLHGLYGARSILLDFSRVGRRGARFATYGFVVIGAVWAWWGITAFRGLP